MSHASTLDQARNFLNLSDAANANEVLQAARDWQDAWKSRLDDPKASAPLKRGSAANLLQLAPMLPFLEVEEQLDEFDLTAKDPPIGKNQLTRLCDNVAQKIATLPDGEEKSMLLCRVEDIRDSAKQKGATTPPPPPPPPPPETKPAPDPALPVFEAKLADLRAAIDREDTNKLRLVRLLAEANKAMSRLREQADRARAEAEIDQFTRNAEDLLLRATAPPMDLSKIVAEGLAAAASPALDRSGLAAAPDLLAKAAEREQADRARAEYEIEQLDRNAKDLLLRATAPPIDPAKMVAERLAAVSTALDRGGLAAAPDLLAKAAALLPKLSGDARTHAGEQYAALAKRLRQLTAAADAAAIARKFAAEKIAALAAAIAQPDLPRATTLLAQARTAAHGLADRVARETAIAELAALARRLEKLLKTPPPKPRLPQPGQVLRLVPREGALVTGFVPVPLHLVARPRFVLGRFGDKGELRADFSVPLAETRVSRANVSLTRQGKKILIQDGAGGKKSLNGSKLDDEPLAPEPVPASFARERIISLGSVGSFFSLTAHHLPTEAPGGPPQVASAIIKAGGKTTSIDVVTGCMKFAAKTDAHLPAQATWIFTDASLGAASANALALPHSGLADTHARVHFWQGAFWIENLRSGNAVRLGDRALGKGESEPLCSGDALHLGQLTYTVTVEP